MVEKGKKFRKKKIFSTSVYYQGPYPMEPYPGVECREKMVVGSDLELFLSKVAMKFHK